MSGIAAFVQRDGEDASSSSIRRMTSAMGHRGPDGNGITVEGSAGLGHQLHCTTPESLAADLPERRGDVAITADVRIDNRSQLLSTLGMGGTRQTIPDSELVLRAYERWGTDCPDRLLGAFAFAIWDADRRRLFCARDHLGVKPLYYTHSPERIAVASEPGPLLSLPGVERTPNERHLGEYFVGILNDERATFFDDLRRLPPGHRLTATAATVETNRYWSLDEIKPFPRNADVNHRRRFRELFSAAVDARLRTAERRPGALLSGGLDSSSIASVAAHLRTSRGEPPLHTFSAVFETVDSCDEGEYIDAVLESGSFEPHFVHGDRVNPIGGLDVHLAHRKAPFYPSLFMLIWRLFREAAAEGVNVVLHGYGGDQTMGSDVRGRFRGLARRGKFLSLAREVRGYSEMFPWVATRDVVWRDVLTPLAPQVVRSLYHRRFDDDRYLRQTFATLDRSFAERSGLTARLAAEARERPAQSQRAIRYRSLTNGEPTFNLELNNIAGAIHGVEPRFPYLDKRLVEFSLALPPGTTVHNGLDRTIVRDALKGILPVTVRNRADKTEFSQNVVHTFRQYALDQVESTLIDGTPRVAEYLDMDGVRSSYERVRSEGTVGDARNLLMATTVERWLRNLFV